MLLSAAVSLWGVRADHQGPVGRAGQGPHTCRSALQLLQQKAAHLGPAAVGRASEQQAGQLQSKKYCDFSFCCLAATSKWLT